MLNNTRMSENSRLREYEEYEAASRICAYSNKDLEDAPIEDKQYSGVWNPSIVGTISKNKLLINQNIRLASAANWVNILYSTSSNSSFTQEALLESEEDQVKKLIERLRALSISCRESIASRLIELFNDAKEEDELVIGITIDSLRNFYNFLRLHKNLKCPKISLTPENDIYASWKTGKDKVFSIHFVASGDPRFVVFAPNNMHPDRPTRISGSTTAENLLKCIAPLGVLSWIME